MICCDCNTEIIDNEATVCVRCHEIFCPSCHYDHRLLLHKNDKDDHFMIEDMKSNFNEENYQGMKYCKRHKDSKVMWFCQTCSYSICDGCAIRRHTNHKVMSLNTYIPDIQTALQGCHKMLQWKESQLQEITEKLEREKSQNEEEFTKIENEIKEAFHSNIMQYLAEIQKQEHKMIEELREMFDENGSQINDDNLTNAQSLKSLVDVASVAVMQCIESQTVVFKKGVFHSLGMINNLDFEELLLNHQKHKNEVVFYPSSSSKVRKYMKQASVIGSFSPPRIAQGKVNGQDDKDVKSRSAPDLLMDISETRRKSTSTDLVETTGETDTDLGEFIVTNDFKLVRKNPGDSIWINEEQELPVFLEENKDVSINEKVEFEEPTFQRTFVERQGSPTFWNKLRHKNKQKEVKKHQKVHPAEDIEKMHTKSKSFDVGELGHKNNKKTKNRKSSDDYLDKYSHKDNSKHRRSEQKTTHANRPRSTSPLAKLKFYKTVFKSSEHSKHKASRGNHTATSDFTFSSESKKLHYKNNHVESKITSKSMYDMNKPPSTISSKQVQQIIRHSSSNPDTQGNWNVVFMPSQRPSGTFNDQKDTGSISPAITKPQNKHSHGYKHYEHFETPIPHPRRKRDERSRATPTPNEVGYSANLHIEKPGRHRNVEGQFDVNGRKKRQRGKTSLI